MRPIWRADVRDQLQRTLASELHWQWHHNLQTDEMIARLNARLWMRGNIKEAVETALWGVRQ